jgi:hypothetical protein
MLMDQKHLCDSMIEEKNKLINDFKQVWLTLNSCWIEPSDILISFFFLLNLIFNSLQKFDLGTSKYISMQSIGFLNYETQKLEKKFKKK